MSQGSKIQNRNNSIHKKSTKYLPSYVWSWPAEKILRHFRVSPHKGLTQKEAKTRLKRFGPNRLQESKKKNAWTILANQFKSLIIVILAAAAAVSFLIGDWSEGTAIAVAIFIFILIGFFTELRAVRSMEALRRLGTVRTKVRRGGNLMEIPAQKLVPGDIVAVEGGDIITADLRLSQASKLQADEAVLTGESLPVDKNARPVEKDAPLAERSVMLFKGTSITRGTGEGVVVATGMETELGRISSLVEETQEEVFTPLEKRLNRLGHKLIWLTGILAVVIAGVGILSGKDIFLMIKTSVILAIAAIPEGLPIVATIALARGVWRMARRNALIERLSSVETLGATNVICSDKTGTLTEGQMTATRIITNSEHIEIRSKAPDTQGDFFKNGKTINSSEKPVLKELLTIGLLCNNASLQKESEGEFKGVGEPLELAILVAGEKAGLDRSRVVQSLPEIKEISFDPETKMMATFHQENSRIKVAAKGAPESVLDASGFVLTEKGKRRLTKKDREAWLKHNQGMAEQGLRVLAFASKETKNKKTAPYEDLVFLGLMGFVDPPRKEAKDAIGMCQNAGVKVVMVTGDHPETARSVAASLNLFQKNRDQVVHSKEIKSFLDLSDKQRKRLLSASVFTRVNPKQKLDLIEIHQKSGSIVAMTGDGVNDAPALKKADIGVAMGKRGTQVAQQAADMVLKDDSFSTIASAIFQGRVIFENIRKFISYLLSCNAGSLLSVTFASLLGLPLPVRPLQILFLNLVTDVFPAIALGLGEADPEIMNRSPRDSQESILTSSHWTSIGIHGLTIALSVIAALTLALKGLKVSLAHAVTISFLTLGFARVWNVFNMREKGSDLFKNEVTINPYIWGSVVICTGLLLAAVYIPGLNNALKLMNPMVKGWSIILGASLVPLVIGQAQKGIHRILS